MDVLEQLNVLVEICVSDLTKSHNLKSLSSFIEYHKYFFEKLVVEQDHRESINIVEDIYRSIKTFLPGISLRYYTNDVFQSIEHRDYAIENIIKKEGINFFWSMITKDFLWHVDVLTGRVEHYPF